jgi:hypothetical protein
MKNIVICCDGTWNTPDQMEQGIPVPTNVVRIFNAVADVDGTGTPQHKYYHPGVGTSGSWWDKAIEGGTGRGLDRNIMSAYRELCDYYESGDRIFLFGFSRGAYTVRSLCGLVAKCGLLDTSGLKEPQIWERIERVFQQGYRRRTEDQHSWRGVNWAFHQLPEKSIHFLGVWDTVGALGIPDDMALLNLLDNLRDYDFHDTDLSPAIQTARHALALDEMRASFRATLWNAQPGQDARQLWFPGVHADVGGGYLETGLSDTTLMWMVHEAGQCGLAFTPDMLSQIEPYFQGVMHDSCTGAFALLATRPRSAPRIVAGNPDISEAALKRQTNPPITQCPYREVKELNPAQSITLDIYAREQWNDTGIWLEAGQAYDFAASGEWMDDSIKCGPEGTADGHFQLAELAHVAGRGLGHLERWFKKLSGNRSADFRFTRRHEDCPWFSLVGAVANGGGHDAKGHRVPHEHFLIGGGRLKWKPSRSGYLFAYANDAWNCYGNNRGRVRLAVSTSHQV